jgi:hypothetical protein
VRDRRRIYSLKKIATAANEVPGRDSILACVMEEARRSGYDVQRSKMKGSVFEGGEPKFYKWRLIVQGKLCEVNHLTASFLSVRGRQKYGKLKIKKSAGYDFRIVVTEFPGCPRRIFIVPRAVVCKSSVFCIPEDKVVGIPGKSRAIIDWWQYENAWHLIRA